MTLLFDGGQVFCQKSTVSSYRDQIGPSSCSSFVEARVDHQPTDDLIEFQQCSRTSSRSRATKKSEPCPRWTLIQMDSVQIFVYILLDGFNIGFWEQAFWLLLLLTDNESIQFNLSRVLSSLGHDEYCGAR